MTRRSVGSRRGKTGISAIVAAMTSILGVLTATFPEVPVWEVITEAIPQLQTAIPVVLTAVGSIVAAWSQPPGKRVK